MQAIGTRPKITVSADGRGVVGHAGARLLADVADATGLTGAFGQALVGLRPRQSRHDPGRVADDVAVMLADGGEAIADLAVLRDQAARPGTAIRKRSRRPDLVSPFAVDFFAYPLRSVNGAPDSAGEAPGCPECCPRPGA